MSEEETKRIKLYKIQIFESGHSGNIDWSIIKLKTNDIQWSMEQYQRNRKALTWEIIEEKDI